MALAFTITYDYLCPFARIANEAVVEALEAGASYEVSFAPFSLHQNSLPDDAPPVWAADHGAESARGVEALLWSLAVRDEAPELFGRFHVALFNARHDDGADISDVDVVRDVARRVGLDVDRVEATVASGVPMKTLAAEHTALVDNHAVFGVPTFIAGDDAVFVRLMERHNLDDLARVIDMIDWSRLNEFKRPTIPR